MRLAKRGRKRSQPKKSTKAHWNQHAGYHIDGLKIASLREVLDPAVPTMSLAELREEQRINLVVSQRRNGIAKELNRPAKIIHQGAQVHGRDARGAETRSYGEWVQGTPWLRREVKIEHRHAGGVDRSVVRIPSINRDN